MSKILGDLMQAKKGNINLEPLDLEASGELCCFMCFDLVVLSVIVLSQHYNGWKLGEFARHLPQAQKRNSYKSEMKKRFEEYLDELTKGKEPGKVRIVLE